VTPSACIAYASSQASYTFLVSYSCYTCFAGSGKLLLSVSDVLCIYRDIIHIDFAHLQLFTQFKT